MVTVKCDYRQVDRAVVAWSVNPFFFFSFLSPFFPSSLSLSACILLDIGKKRMARLDREMSEKMIGGRDVGSRR